MKHILIIEDDAVCAKHIRQMLVNIDEEIVCGKPLCSVEDVIAKIRQREPYDLIISDIKLQNHLVFEAFDVIMPPKSVIFIATTEEYALKSFKYNAIDYLLKPIKENDLRSALEKAFIKGVCIMNNYNENRSSHHRILVSHGDELISLPINDILYFHKEDTFVVVYTNKGNTFHISQTMNELEEMLPSEDFFRLNRQFIASFNGINKISFFFNSKLIVRLNGYQDNIVISKAKTNQFKKWLNL